MTTAEYALHMIKSRYAVTNTIAYAEMVHCDEVHIQRC